jgi:hypothetical protein
MRNPIKFLLSLVIVLAMISFTSSATENNSSNHKITPASDYCSGWKAGYIRGYCYNNYGCIPPIVPICPIPFLGQTSYSDGYDRGFSAGRADN